MYGRLRNIPIKPTEYTGKETDTTVTIVDNREYTVAVDVKSEKFPTVEQLEAEVFLREKADQEITQHIDESIREEASERAAADNDLSVRISTEAQTRADADNDLSRRVAQEAQTRAAADDDLSTRIYAEAETRASADTDLSNRLNTEVSAREAADNNLSIRLSVESQERQSTDSAIINRLATEEQARSDADTDLSSRIFAETQARADADTDLSTRLNAEAQARTNADSDLQSQISAEKQARQDDDSALLTRLQQEESIRQSQVADLDTRLNTEATKRAAADTDLSNRLNNEKTAREAEDNNILALIADEATARSDRDSQLARDITSEATSRANADSALYENISRVSNELALEIQDRATADRDLSQAIDLAINNEASDRQYEDMALQGQIDTLSSQLSDVNVKNTDSYIDITQTQDKKEFTVNAAQNLLDLISNKWSYQVCTNAENTPYGVTWETAQHETVTGTLVASASTQYKFYLVPAHRTSGSDIYEEYITVVNGANYSWEKFGETDIDLSGYATKQWVTEQDYVTTSVANSTYVPLSSTGDVVIDNSGTLQIGCSDGGATVNFSSDTGNVSITATSATVNNEEIATEDWVEDKHYFADGQLHTQMSSTGTKGWYFKSWKLVDGSTTDYEVELINADRETYPDSALFEPREEDGKTIYVILSAKATFSASFALQVMEVLDQSTCKLRLIYTDNFKCLNAQTSGVGEWNPANHLYDSLRPGYAWIPENPTAGTVSVGYGSMAIGSDNKANEWGSLAIGNINLVDGRYGFANGESNKVAYSSVALGHNNTVYAYDGLAVGSYNTIRNWRTAAFGTMNSMNAINGFVSGHGNQATAAAHDGINIRGCFAKTQSSDTFIDVVGCGEDADHRKNVLAVSKGGSLRIKGDIFVYCADDSSGGTNLRTSIEGVRTDVGNLQTNVGNLQTAVGGMQTDVGNLQNDLGLLQTNVGVIQTDVAVLQDDVGDIQTGVSGLQTDVSELQTDVGDLQSTVGSIQTDVGGIHTDVGGLQTDVSNLQTAVAGKEDKGTLTFIEEVTIPENITGDYEYTIPGGKRCVVAMLSIKRELTTTESYRVFANETDNWYAGGQINATAPSGSQTICNAKVIFDCYRGFLNAECAYQNGLGGYVSKTTYAGYLNEPVLMDTVNKIIIRNVTNQTIHKDTKIKIYGC